MSVDNSGLPPPAPAAPETTAGPPLGTLTRHLLRSATAASLATIDRATTGPFASLVAVASAADATPLLLLSALARHTENLLADPRASLLIGGRGAGVNPLAEPRATLVGRIRIDASPRNLARYLRRHPAAAAYAEFKDFRLYSLAVESAHVVRGFGRIAEVEAQDILLGPKLAPAEQSCLDALRDGEADLIADAGRDDPGSKASAKRGSLIGIDVEGIDRLVEGRHVRIELGRIAGDARELVELARRP